MSMARVPSLVTEQCLLQPNRNPGLAQQASRRCFAPYLGVSQVLWLGQGVVNDETSGHVDNLACFARPGEVCLSWSERRRDPLYRDLAGCAQAADGSRDARGRRLRVHKLPAPGPCT